MVKFKSPPNETWEGYWLGIYNRLERGVAWVALSLGATILLTYALYHMVTNMISGIEEQPLIISAVLLLLIGIAILFVSVIREKLTVRKKDPYREVKQ